MMIDGNRSRYFNPSLSRLVHIQPDHRRLSIPGSSRGCPVAVAMREQGYEGVVVGLDMVMFRGGVGGHELRIGQRLRDWIDAYEADCAINGLPVLRDEPDTAMPVPLWLDMGNATIDIDLGWAW